MQATGFRLIPYDPALAGQWDAVVAAAPGGTVLHSRRFLDYHGTRFRDLGLLGQRPGTSAPSVVLPLAADPGDAGRVVSHPGSSFGGVIGTSLDPAHHRAFLVQAAAHLRDQGFDRLLYRTTPGLLLRQPDDGMQPFLLRLGRIVQVDLWSVLRLDAAGPERRYWLSEIRRGGRKGLVATPVQTGAEWQEFHDTLSERLARKHGARPVHSVAELVDLQARLGAQSRAILVRGPEGRVLAAQWFLDYGTGTLHNQYNGATDEGLAQGAASFGIAVTLERALSEGFRQFSFGRSTEADGWSENRALLRFKARFGAGLASQFHIELPLDRLIEAGL